MPDSSDIADVFAHYVKLPSRDRKAVMAALDAPDRLRLKRFIALTDATSSEAGAEDSDNDNALTPVSPWLWDALEERAADKTRTHTAASAAALLKRHVRNV